MEGQRAEVPTESEAKALTALEVLVVLVFDDAVHVHKLEECPDGVVDPDDPYEVGNELYYYNLFVLKAD